MDNLTLTPDMSKPQIAAAARTHLTGVHAYNLRDHINHPPEESDIVFRAEGTALLVIRLWIEKKPPFRHKVITLALEFEDGFCTASDVSAINNWGD